MTTTKTYAATTRRTDGALLWQMTEVGPRGGSRRWYAPRADGAASPTGWEIWSERQRDVGDTLTDRAGSASLR